MTIAAFEAVETDGVLAGPERRPVNLSRDAAGSIHDDATAQKLGFRGGTVAGNIHCEQFPPLIIRRLGPEWRRRGGLSLHFMNATTDGEPVRAFIGPETAGPGGLRIARIWMETPEGVRVMEGDAWVGGRNPESELAKRVAASRPATDLRILASRKVGDTCKDTPARINAAVALRRLEGVTEPLPEYRDPTEFGERVAAPAVAIDVLRAVEQPLFKSVGDFVGMFGAIELEFLDGPVLLDTDYLADGEIKAFSESPKTEVTWYESVIRPAAGGPLTARMLMMSRVLKASSPLWA